MKKCFSTPWTNLVFVLSISMFMGSASLVFGGSEKGENVMSISAGKEVSIEYTLKLEDQTMVDTNVGDQPLTYTHGSHQIIPGLEKALEGMKIGESKKVTVKPEEGYGPVDPNAFMEADKKLIPSDALKVDSLLQGQDNNGRAFTARVSEIKEQTVVLDLNHPLAGKTLYFDVKVLNIGEAKHP
jgi:FKBP-type peptidyl-prolyl cis-trans isomerase SlyD